jgi:DNA-binding CsgD family transcriptional regulator
MMVDDSSEDIIIIKSLIDLGIDATEVLGKFQCDNHECVAVKLGNNSSDNPVDFHEHNCHSLTEICRFNVNGCDCAIVKKASDQEADELNLSLVLTARELQIATLVALGCPNKQVADKLHISEWTVATYLRRVFAKLGVDTRAAMTYRCAALIIKQDELLNKADSTLKCNPDYHAASSKLSAKKTAWGVL